MSRGLALSIFIGAVVFLLLGSFIWWFQGRGEEALTTTDGPEFSLGEDPVDLIPAKVYFPGPDGKLHSEDIEIAAGGPDKKIRALVERVLSGPENRHLWRVLPETVELAGVYLGADSIAYVDLHQRDNGPPPAAGSLQETLTVFSLVNSIVFNVPEVDRLVLLWNGNQRSSFAGHIDTGKPLAPRLTLVAGQS